MGMPQIGASNMQGQYKGFSSLMTAQSPTHVHVWCYAHVLNLVLCETTQAVIESGSLFGLINDIAVFIRESIRGSTYGRRQSRRRPETGASAQLGRHGGGKNTKP